jgi:CHASE2 domain-containing sensor protein
MWEEMPPGGTLEPDKQPAADTVPATVRVQILATEHWSLLGTRSTTWAEVMSRISIHLTVASAGLVVLALVAQVAGFGTAFDILSIGLASVVLVLGSLTGVRAHHRDEPNPRGVRGHRSRNCRILRRLPA